MLEKSQTLLWMSLIRMMRILNLLSLIMAFLIRKNLRIPLSLRLISVVLGKEVEMTQTMML